MCLRFHQETYKLKHAGEKLSKIFRRNTSLGLLSFIFVSDRSFKFLMFQIGPLSFEFVSDKSFKFPRFQISSLSFEFVSNMLFLSTSVNANLIWLGKKLMPSVRENHLTHLTDISTLA